MTYGSNLLNYIKVKLMSKIHDTRVRDAPETSAEIEGAFWHGGRKMVDIIPSDSTGPNSRSLKGHLLFRFDWIEV